MNSKNKVTSSRAEDDALLLALRSVDFNDDGCLVKDDMVNALLRSGLNEEDPRLQATFNELAKYGDDQEIEVKAFADAVRRNRTILTRMLTGQLILPEFRLFADEIEKMFKAAGKNKSGEIATYIPQLAKEDPEKMAASLCTVDGQYYSAGDYDDYYCLQSTCKPLLYALALEENGEGVVHRHTGREPSGVSFNELTLNKKGLPHNPMVNAGAIMSCSLIKPKLPIAERFDYVMTQIQAMAGEHHEVSFDNSVYLSEKDTGDRNFALGYFMKEKGAFPKNTDLQKTLEFYFQCCAIKTTARGFAGIAATLANAGIQPLTGEKVLSPSTVKDCLSLMLTCGMYDYSGEWAFLIGLPAKSGVSGALQVIVPGVMGISVWSPRLDPQGNSVRGVDFLRKMIARYNFHTYDAVVKGNTGKRDPRHQQAASAIRDTLVLLSAASTGDLEQIMRLTATGTDLNAADYDGRTAIHLAASEGQMEVLEYLISKGARLDCIDRWQNTPLDDAKREGHGGVERLLKGAEKRGAMRSDGG